MEIYCMVIFCVLFTIAANLSAVDAISEYANDSLILQRQNCNCENGRCFTDKEGHMKCACKPGFALQDEFTCKPCDCGSLGKCIFTLKPTNNDQIQYQKKCVCNPGSAEKDGICVDCFCGDNSECDFDHGERRCFCMEGYSEKDGVCTKCDCGFYGKCKYQNGDKKCECDEGFFEFNGVCEECDCGDHGTCFIQNGKKTCVCQPGFNVNNGICESCDCGSNSDYCGFFNGVKKCMCKDGYADRYGTCEECYCGKFSRNCDFYNNQKTCSCLEGYAQKGETCEPGCDDQKPCQNGGYCKDGFCFCLNGTRGEFCEVIEGCSDLCPKNLTDIECSYDIASQKAFCKCLDSELIYDSNSKGCKRTCNTNYPCVSGECRKGMCECLPGTWGDRCENVDCVTGATKCDLTWLFWKGRYSMIFLWKGKDMLFVLWKQKLMKFVRTDVILPRDVDHSALHIKCDDHRYNDILWKPEEAVYVSTKDYKYVRYQIENQSTGLARCSSNTKKEGTCNPDCVSGECRNGVCECLPGTSGDRCENVDCMTGAAKCDLTYLFLIGRHSMVFLWKGKDTLFVLWKQKLLKFVRTDVLSVIYDHSALHITCDDHRYKDILWSAGQFVYVTTPDYKYARYQIENHSSGLARCSSNTGMQHLSDI